MKNISQKLEQTVLSVIIWALVVGIAYGLQMLMRTDYIGDISFQEHMYTFLFGLGIIVLISGFQASPRFPALLETRWFLFHLILCIFSYIVYQNVFFETIMLQELHTGIFLKKEAAFGTVLMDKILGNGFSVYAMVLMIHTWVTKRREPDNLISEEREQPAYTTQLKVKQGKKIYFIPTDSIDYIQASNNYVDVFADGKKHVIRESLSHLEQVLNPVTFIRVHRSSMINAAFVEAFISMGNGHYMIKLQNGLTLKVGNTYKGRVLQQFGLALENVSKE